MGTPLGRGDERTSITRDIEWRGKYISKVNELMVSLELFPVAEWRIKEPVYMPE